MKKILIILLVLLTSCSYFFKKKTERVLARVYDEYLYESDLKSVIPKGTPVSDSIVLAQNFIAVWVNQRLVLHQAKSNLSDERMDFSDQLDSYRNSLIIYEYENELVKQKLDTVVSNEEIESYYGANQQNFLLKDNIVQLQYIKVPSKSPNINQLKKLLGSDRSEDKTRLSELCEKFAADYFLDDQNWIYFHDLLKEIPIKTYNQEEFLKNHREVVYQDSMYIYLVRFRDFKVKETVSPLSFEKEKIKDIIINKRKIDLITNMHQDIYDKAFKKNDFEIYK